ncbi:MAG: ATP phosphoribosyltransferase [Candidatus Vidania fulgoroideorum]
MNIGISKGRILKKIMKIIKIKKIKLNRRRKRELLIKIKKKNITISPIKSKDFAFFLKNKMKFCIVGIDTLKEIKNYKKFKFIKLKFFKCKLSIITNNKFEDIYNFYNNNKKVKNIYSKYKKITKKFLKNNNIKNNKFKNIKVKKINGNSEILLILKISKYISDIVETGKTIIDNNLYEVEKICNLFPIIVFKKNNKNIEKINEIISILK